MSYESKVRALLATARIANVPSVLSNLAVGVVLGSVLSEGDFRWPWLMSIAVVLFYISANFLNDWKDLDWDRKNRPERALPQELFSPRIYLTIGSLGLVAGLILAGLYGVLALVISLILVALIAQYTWIHKQVAWSVIPMGLCRACLPLLGFSAVLPLLEAPVIIPAIALLIYIVSLSLSARWEARGDLPAKQKWQARGLLLGAGLLAAGLPLIAIPSLGWLGLIPFGLWMFLCFTKFQSPVPAHVSGLLAGIPLVDWALLLPMGFLWYQEGLIEKADPVFLICLLLAPICFICGRLLQRLAPAT